MKGVLLAGGTGSRLSPLTKITNKHLLPIYDRPMVEWSIEALVEGGVRDLMLVTGGTHAGDFVRLLGDGHDVGLERLAYAYQDRPGGIAEALGLAERFVDGEPFVVMLADNVFECSVGPFLSAFDADPHGARVLLAEMGDRNHLRHLGVPDLDATGRVRRILEKPAVPPCAFAVTGIYCYDPDVFGVISSLVRSERGELEITDVNNHYAALGDLAYDVVEGFWGDAGESIEAYYAVNDFVRAHLARRGRKR